MASHEIHHMHASHFEEILNVDAKSFGRNEPRSHDNLRCLYENFPEGCFVVTVNQSLAGYLLCHRLGTVGYLGSLAVKEAYRGQDMGKDLLSQGIAALQRVGCTVIGLETLATWGYNIGLYSTMGFMLTYPTIVGRLELQRREKTLEIVNGHHVEPRQLEHYDATCTQHYAGYSLLSDMVYTIQHHPETIWFALRRGEIQGFLAYDNDVYPFLWGSFVPMFQASIFAELYTALQTCTGQQQLLIRVNARYDVFAALLSLGFRVEIATVRMLLRGYEGNFSRMAGDEAMVLRAWVA